MKARNVIALLVLLVFVIAVLNRDKLGQLLRTKPPEAFRNQTLEVFNKVAKLEATVNSGSVAFLEFKEEVRDVVGSLNALRNFLPVKGIEPGSCYSLFEATDLWGAALDMWEAAVRDDYKCSESTLNQIHMASMTHEFNDLDFRRKVETKEEFDAMRNILVVAGFRKFAQGRDALMPDIK